MSKQAINEGKATIVAHLNNDQNKNEVFYNPVQEFNRDLSIFVIRHYIDSSKFEEKQQNNINETKYTSDETIKINTSRRLLPEGKVPGVTLVEALSATGLRGIRYAKEIDQLDTLILNDIKPEAAQSIVENVRHNQIDPRKNVVVTQMDCNALMHVLNDPSNNIQPHIIDLDPYGSAAPFVESTVSSIKDGGLLCVTCTDMAVLCGNHPETAYTKYGGQIFKTKCCHELALRAVLHCIDQAAAKFKKHIVPLISLSIDFYVRLFVRVHSKPGSELKRNCIFNKGFFSYCPNCFSFEKIHMFSEKGKNIPQNESLFRTVKKCEVCSVSLLKSIGPTWIGPTFDVNFVTSALANQNNFDNLKTKSRIEGMLSLLSEELNNTPLYYSVGDMFCLIKMSCPPIDQLLSALHNKNFLVSFSHAKTNSFKTNAPSKTVWQMILFYAKQNLKDDDPKLLRILEIFNKQLGDLTDTFDFTLNSSIVPESKRKRLLRYQINPQPHWGPKSRDRIH